MAQQKWSDTIVLPFVESVGKIVKANIWTLPDNNASRCQEEVRILKVKFDLDAWSVGTVGEAVLYSEKVMKKARQSAGEVRPV